MNITLFGGSFNPPHIGHALIIEEFLSSGLTDELWLLPTYNHAFNKSLAPSNHRLKMCELLIDFLTKSTDHQSLITGHKLKLCPIEIDYKLSGSTFDTLQVLKKERMYLKEKLLIPSSQFYPELAERLIAQIPLETGFTKPSSLTGTNYSFLMGSDQLPNFHKWQHYRELLQQMTFHVYPRCDYPMEPLYPGMKPFIHKHQTITNLSSTFVRNRLIHHQACSLIVPPEILAYIQTHKLYLS
jgi:nicotinate (nicotinamide) nucleotide adenylyltransferase